MVEKILLIAKIGVVVASLIPCIIVYIKKIKDLKKAKESAEKERIINELKESAQDLIVEAENTYRTVDEILKSQGSSSGAVKKESVMSKLRIEAIEKGIKFDAEYWSGVIDKLVAITKKVNIKL